MPWHPPLIEKCEYACTGAPTVYVYGGKQRVTTHYHQLCWMCGTGVIGASPGAYHCHSCEYKQGTWTSPPGEPRYDPQEAAERSTP